ncbi:polymerase [Arthrobacter livingstonensis]|uniref:Polymerase n=2 Tax=Arthrobacter livingstonensis TaxID=670078 RepID=A0A2V5LLM0_9MICC|nr:polymerase [Arthrobacter livingstonensis]
MSDQGFVTKGIGWVRHAGPDEFVLDFNAPPRVSKYLLFVIVSIFVFPHNMVLKPLGAAGTVPLILAVILFCLWICSVLFGLHDPLGYRNPGRLSIGVLWVGTCISYVALYMGLTGGSTVAGRASADRWMILLMGSSALILVITEAVKSMNDAMEVVRIILLGAFFCSIVAVIQFFLRINPMEWIQAVMPGFTDNGGATPFQNRGFMVRVAGSTFHSIELAVVSAILLPLSIWRGIFDKTGRKWFHWTGTALLIFAVASTVSRSGILALVIAVGIFIPFLPLNARRWALVVAPIALCGLFLAIPGLISTLTSSFTAGDSDPSITTRTDNYPRVARMFVNHPWVGTGPGTYLPDNALYILDNQYLNVVVSMGAIGLVCIVVYLMFPGLTSVLAARAAKGESLRSLVGALAGGCVAAGICSLTFDSLAFPTFAMVYPVLVGLGGAGWILVKKEMSLNASEEIAATNFKNRSQGKGGS